MNGVALLVALALPGVEYSLETTADGQQLYTIQVPAEVLLLLLDGKEIHSEVPPEATHVQRLCIRVGTPVKHTAAAEQQFRQLLVSAGRIASASRSTVAVDGPPTILWPARARPEQTYYVTSGWQPDVNGNQQYFVQIDPTMLRTLAAGDEVHVPVDPTAGRTAQFVIKSGKDDLPRIAAPPAQIAPATASPPLANAGQLGRHGIGSAPLAGAPTTPSSASARIGDIGPLPSTTSAATPSTSFSGTAGDYGRSGYGSSRFNPAPEAPVDPRSSSFNPAASPTHSSRDPLSIDRPRTSASDPRAGYAPASGYSHQAVPAASDPRSYGATSVPPTSSFDRSASAIVQPPYAAPAAAPYAAPAAPELAQLPPRTSGYGPVQPDYRVASAPTAAATALPPSPVASLSPTTSIPPAADRPWTPFLLAMIALFFSIGGNLYLAWTALEFHTRYRNAIERLRSAARSS